MNRFRAGKLIDFPALFLNHATQIDVYSKIISFE